MEKVPMMKKIFLTLLFFQLTFTAQSGNSNELSSKKWESNENIANLGPGCRIKITIPKQAKLIQGYPSAQYRGRANFLIEMPPSFSNDGLWWFKFNCFQTKEEEFKKFWTDVSPQDGAKFNIKSNRKSFTNKEGEIFTSLRAINALGWAFTFDDTTGDENFRTRHLSYCIRNETNAICGNSDIGYIEYLENKRNIDTQSAAIRILESIEFLEDAAPSR